MSTDAISHSLELISSDIGYIIFIVISKTRQELEMETNNLERTNNNIADVKQFYIQNKGNKGYKIIKTNQRNK